MCVFALLQLCGLEQRYKSFSADQINMKATKRLLAHLPSNAFAHRSREKAAIYTKLKTLNFQQCRDDKRPLHVHAHYLHDDVR